jgi:hypothetical protein
MKIFAHHPLRMTFLVVFVLAGLFLMQVACGWSVPTGEPESGAEVENASPDDPAQVEGPAEVSATFTTAPSKTPTLTEEPPTETPIKTPTKATVTPKISRTPRPSMTASPIVPEILVTSTVIEWLPDPSISNPPETDYYSNCEIIDQQPAGFTDFAPGTHFDLVWEVRNVGTIQWEADHFFFKYISGAHFEKYGEGDRFEFDHLVGPERTIKFVVDFVAPNDPGIYETHWAIIDVDTNEIACDLYFGLNVK